MKQEPEIYRTGKILTAFCNAASFEKSPTQWCGKRLDGTDHTLDSHAAMRILATKWVALFHEHERKLATEPLDWRRLRLLLPLIDDLMTDPINQPGDSLEANYVLCDSRLASAKRLAEAWLPVWHETEHLFASGMHLRPEFIEVAAPEADTKGFCPATFEALAVLTDLQRCAVAARATDEAAVNKLLAAHARLKSWLFLNRQSLVPRIRQHMTMLADLKAVVDVDRRDPWGAMSLHRSESLERAITKIAYLDEMLRGIEAVAVPALPAAPPVAPPPVPTMPPEPKPEAKGTLLPGKKYWRKPCGQEIKLPFGATIAEMFRDLDVLPFGELLPADGGKELNRMDSLRARVNANCQAVGANWKATQQGGALLKKPCDWSTFKPPAKKPAKSTTKKPARGKSPTRKKP